MKHGSGSAMEPGLSVGPVDIAAVGRAGNGGRGLAVEAAATAVVERFGLNAEQAAVVRSTVRWFAAEAAAQVRRVGLSVKCSHAAACLVAAPKQTYLIPCPGAAGLACFLHDYNRPDFSPV